MNNTEFIDTIVKTRGKDPEEGDLLYIAFDKEDYRGDFKNSLIIMGKNGFRAYPSETHFLTLFNWVRKGETVLIDIIEKEKENTFRALFHKLSAGN
ncbi:MAG: hypothetical protein ACI4EW_03030 [Butyrivibrio sp.]